MCMTVCNRLHVRALAGAQVCALAGTRMRALRVLECACMRVRMYVRERVHVRVCVWPRSACVLEEKGSRTCGRACAHNMHV